MILNRLIRLGHNNKSFIINSKKVKILQRLSIIKKKLLYQQQQQKQKIIIKKKKKIGRFHKLYIIIIQEMFYFTLTRIVI
jgi:hypothetical protein